jgi:hypothetical protein
MGYKRRMIILAPVLLSISEYQLFVRTGMKGFPSRARILFVDSGRSLSLGSLLEVGRGTFSKVMFELGSGALSTLR